MPNSAPDGEKSAVRQLPGQETVTRQELDERLARERHRLAKELHDTLGQSLTAIYLNAKFVERKLEQDDSKAAADIFALGETIHGAVQELHGIMSRLLTGAKPSPDATRDSGESRPD